MPAPPQRVERTGLPGWMIALVIAVLLGGGIWLVYSMDEVGKEEDCGMSGRRNCNVYPELGR